MVDVPETLPRCASTPRLLERAIANIVANASRLVAARPAGADRRSAAGAPGGAPGDRPRPGDRAAAIASGCSGRSSGWATVERAAGVGLGLAVARGFVEAMDGELSVEDTPGGGLTMVLASRRHRT